MEVRSKMSDISISAQKLRLVCDLVRGMNAELAVSTLGLVPKKGAEFISKALKSALANAQNNYDLNPSSMFVQTIFADEGPSLKRFKAGARGRYKPRKRRTAHLTIVLAESEGK